MEQPETNEIDLQQQVVDALQQNSKIESSDIEVTIEGNHAVVLYGSVSDPEMIEIAYNTVRDLGVGYIRMNIQVA